MSDRYTEVSHQGWLSRLGESIKGVLVGAIMILVSFPVLWFNEGRAVQTARSLSEGAGAVVEASADKVDPAQEGKLIHVSGNVTVTQPVTDTMMGVTANALKLERVVEMYQWEEHVSSRKEKKLGGGEETVKTYDYRQGWHERAIPSSSFKVKEGHANPGSMPYSSETFTAPGATLGARPLPDRISHRLGKSQDHPVTAVPPALAGKALLSGSQLYVGKDISAPQVGDIRIRFKVTPPGPASIVSMQAGASFAPYKASAGDDVELVQDGIVPAAQMFQSAQSANETMTWILRVLGFILMTMGFYFIMRPLAVVADVVPFIGSVLAFGAGLAAALLASVFSSVTVAVAWLFYRPLVAILMFVLGGAAFAVIAGMNHRRKVLRQVRGELPA